jgi:peptidoglycan hydrolase-like protein with peptidoglycan-binding domain
MPLQSQLLGNDPDLEAASLHDKSHITPGSSGEHVRKIQAALNMLDQAGLAEDGIYGPRTAAAVKAFKKRHDIINRSYQSTVDDIVGKMTIAELDRLVREAERNNGKRVRLVPISPGPSRSNFYPRAEVISTERKGKFSFDAKPTLALGSHLPTKGLEIMSGQTGTFEVKDGIGYVLGSTAPEVLTIFRPDQPNAHDGQFRVDANPQTFGVRGRDWGTAFIVAQRPGSMSLFDRETLIVNVKDPRPTVYKKTDAHNHGPCQNCWDAICASSENAVVDFSSAYLRALAIARAKPRTVVDEAKRRAFGDKPLALGYLNYYLGGQGGTLNEDRHLDMWLRGDQAARRNIADEIRDRKKTTETLVTFWFEFDQDMFGDQDFRFMYGTIDYFHVEANFIAGTVKVWFMDCYEWHPPHPQFMPPCPNLKPRNTNFLHAALVQMKNEGARDFWMRGEATFPITLFPI